MANLTMEEQVKRFAEKNGIVFYHIRTDQFKTNTINVFFHDRLSRENATRNAILPAVMRRGCTSHPTFQDIALYLESLYGASFDCGVTKKGERQIIQFYMEFVSDEYTESGGDLFRKSTDFLYEVITSPVSENQGFKPEYLAQEKENLKRLIEGRVNDKVQYAVERCFEEMCKGEPFAVYENGSIPDLEAIEGRSLYQYYTEFIQSQPVSIFITGNIPQDQLDYLIGKFSAMKRGSIKEISSPLVHKDVTEEKAVAEKMNVSQGKLSLGFRTHTSPSEKDYYALVVYNGILGGGMHSKLFQNVREKASLAYYAFSRLEKFKGLMMVSSGIEGQNREKAQKIILEQIEEIRKGNISDYEYQSTLKTLETGLKSLRDSQIQLADYYLSQTVSGTWDTIDQIIEKFKSVTKEDVVALSGKIKLDTVYFLQPEGA